MASALYTSYKVDMLHPGGTSVDLSSDTIKVTLISTSDYTFSAAHVFYGPTGANVTRYLNTTDQTLGGKAVTGGAFTVSDATFTAVSQDGSKVVNALILYKSTGTPNSDPLVCYIDGFSVTPNGGNITVHWATNVFSL